MIELKDMTEKELMLYNYKIINELKSRKIIRTKNNPIADYCEWLVSEKFGWKLEKSSNAGFDAYDSNGFRVQIKCRTLEKGKGTRQLGIIRNLDSDTFDYLIALLFDEDIEVVNGYKISKDLIKQYSKLSKHQNGLILYLKGGLLLDERIENITQRFK